MWKAELLNVQKVTEKWRKCVERGPITCNLNVHLLCHFLKIFWRCFFLSQWCRYDMENDTEKKKWSSIYMHIWWYIWFIEIWPLTRLRKLRSSEVMSSFALLKHYHHWRVDSSCSRETELVYIFCWFSNYMPLAAFKRAWADELELLIHLIAVIWTITIHTKLIISSGEH